MNLQDDPGAVLDRVLPDQPPPPAQFDLDKIVRDGYRARRRHRAVLGGAATAGVAGVATVLAFTVIGLPGGSAEPAEDDPIGSATPPAAEETIEDPAMAGYPYREEWGMSFSEGMDGNFDPNEELMSVKDAATEAFGQLLVDGGVWEDPANPAPEENCSYILEEGGAQEEYDECMAEESGMNVGPNQTEGNYGQTYLRSYGGGEVEELEATLRTIFEFEVALPGGWTADPGPITEQVFPQHLISDGPYFTDEAPEFVTEDLDDGRTLMVADHGCAAEVAVVYPNGTGLRATWNNCEGENYTFDLDALVDAALAMPELDFDTSELAPVGDLNEVPMGWVYDEDAWANSAEAEADAASTYAAAEDAIQDAFPGATLSDGSAVSLGLMDRGASMKRSYSGSGTLPIETTIDGTSDDVDFDLTYYLPGGWLPGYSETGHWDGHNTVCKEEYVCTTANDSDGSLWAFEEYEKTYEPGPGEDWEAYTEHDMYVTYYSVDGWAVGTWVQWTGDTAIDADLLGDLLRAVPEPVYDEDAVPEIPAG
jgi:hypothetical protein